MSAVPLWGDARPLSGCEVIRPPDPEPAPAYSLRTKPGGVGKKLVMLNRFLDRSARTLSPSAALVWVLLWRDERGGTARTAVSDLARRSGLSPRTVKRALQALRTGVYLSPVHRGTPTTGPTVYRLWPTSKRGVTDGP